MRSKYDVDVRQRGERSAAAATRTPPASPSRGRWPGPRGSCELLVEAIAHGRVDRARPCGCQWPDGAELPHCTSTGHCPGTADGRRARRRQARGADLARRRGARAARAWHPRIGHTGTLDPLATGVLPLVVGRATRLASSSAAREKEYDAGVRLGLATETYDAAGRVGPPPDRRRGIDRHDASRRRSTSFAAPSSRRRRRTRPRRSTESRPTSSRAGTAGAAAGGDGDRVTTWRSLATTGGLARLRCPCVGRVLRPVARARPRARASAAGHTSRRCGGVRAAAFDEDGGGPARGG